MKTSRLPGQLAKNASKLHKHVGLLLEELFPSHNIRQEYCVSKVNPEFGSNREKFDWVVFGGGINFVCEIHGQQHFKAVCFGGISLDDAKKNLIKRKDMDFQKKEAALEAGWGYVMVRYDEKKITKEELYDRISESIEESKPTKSFEKKSVSKIQSKGFNKDAPKKKIQSRGFQKSDRKYKWPKRKLNNNS